MEAGEIGKNFAQMGATFMSTPYCSVATNYQNASNKPRSGNG